VRGVRLVLRSEGWTPAGRPIEELHPPPLARCVQADERTREPILGIEILAEAFHDSLPWSVCGLDETSGSDGSGWLSLAAIRMIKMAMRAATMAQINHV
jgi:hypothetical protein